MVARTKARKRALDVLFESELQGLAPGGTLSARVASASPPMSGYAISLVEGVVAHRERIDELLSTYAVGWTLDRMPVVDRNLLRIGTYEILYRDDIPDVVAISEAVSLARELSTDESPGFVNGLLGRIVELKPTLSR
ncbi:MAG: transcription antitermination factor NusB [Jiangellaceae bacterium]